jgi:hypothetical protein
MKNTRTEHQISEPSVLDNSIVETCVEEWCAVSTQEIVALKEKENRALNTLTGSLD